ncbi:MAG: MBOAT family O-acyltransferase [Lachnospiraceae bacterium]|nr:MBOAT family O-acyltransferase [Lachnospiraceae bacterium]
MVFNSFAFLCFFPIVVFIYFLIPAKCRYIWLLLASYYFYMSWNPKYALLIAASTIVTYLSGLLISRYRTAEKASLCRLCVAGSLVINLGILFLFKYADFFFNSLGVILGKVGIQFAEGRFDLLLPVGISFYTFQALGYTIDVYRGQTEAERNPLRYALFVSFFPQLVAGPIERSKNLLTQLQNIHTISVWQHDRVRDGLLLMMWGLFQKIVIADRAALIVDPVINHYDKYGFLEISFAVILFAVQIYCDFAGYTNIARGAAKVMGFELSQNFKQPYLARNIKDFWRRWHMSLTSWFTDYLYIPLGGNRKGTIRKYANIAFVFGVSGLWHGAGWHYVVWGLLHAVYQIGGDLLGRVKQRLGIRERQGFSVALRQRVVTFFLVDFAWIFFVAAGLSQAIGIIRQMLTVPVTCGIAYIGMSRSNFLVLGGSILLLLVVDIMHENKMSLFSWFRKQELWFRIFCGVGLVGSVILFGIYGYAYDPTTFIYFQF